MSDVIGLVSIGDSEHEVFLGRELVQRRQVSEHTARLVDQEVKRILDAAHDRARTVLEEQRDLLDRIAQALLERETLDREQIKLLERDEPLPPMPPPTPLPSSEGVTPRKIPVPGRGLTLPGGEGPLPGPAPGFVDGDAEESPEA